MTDEGALWFARTMGRARDVLLHVIDRLEQ